MNPKVRVKVKQIQKSSTREQKLTKRFNDDENHLEDQPCAVPSAIRVKLKQVQKATPNRPPQTITKKDVISTSGAENIVIVDGKRGEDGTDKEQTQLETETIVEFTRGVTNKGGVCLWYQGYRYNKGCRDYWRCFYRICGSRATVFEEDGKILGTMRGEHCHPPHPELREAEEKREELRKRVREDPDVDIGALITSVRFGMGDEAFVAMGTESSLRLSLWREKRKMFGNINQSNINDMEIPPSLIERDGCSILLYDSRTVRPNDENVVLVFAHAHVLQQFAMLDNWALYGSLRITPKNFERSMAVGGFIRDEVFIAAHAIFNGNSTNLYTEALKAISSVFEPVKPGKVISEWDEKIVSATQKLFPGAQIRVCFFNWAQAIYRKWRELKLDTVFGQEETREGRAARMTFRRVLCLALIPGECVSRGFYLISDKAPSILAEFLYFFKSTFIGLTEEEEYWKEAAFGEQHDKAEEKHGAGCNNLATKTKTPSTSHCKPTQIVISSPSFSSFDATLQRVISSSATETTTILPFGQHPRAICIQPILPVSFWNIYDEADIALVRANSSMEFTRNYFTKGNGIFTNLLQPAMASYLVAFWEDVQKQLDRARSSAIEEPPINNKKRKRFSKNVVREDQIASILRRANFDSDISLANTLDSLSYQIQAYIGGLQYDVRSQNIIETPPRSDEPKPNKRAR